jgi:nitroreductase
MDVFTSIKERRSIRRYSATPIADDTISQLLEAARLAPSAKNLQNWKFILITDQTIKNRLVPACHNQRFIVQAPLVIAGVADPAYKWYQVDIGIVFEHIALEAVELGLGTCWIGAFQEPEVSGILQVPQHLETVILMTVGYADEHPHTRSRKSIEEIQCFNKYTG